MVSSLLPALANLLLLLFLPPLFTGIIVKVKSVIGGRKGPPILQPYYDIIKLFRKGSVYSKSTSFVFRIAPMVVCAAILCAGLLIPMAGESPFCFSGDVILFVYFLAMARFFVIASALDTASSFEGMGASREAAFGAFAELSIIVTLITLAVVTKATSLDTIFFSTSDHFIAEPTMLMLAGTFLFVLLAENSRMPVDDPNTHLELTMIHEVMVLDYSGPDLGLILYSSSMKLFIYMVFAVLLISPNAGYGLLAGSAILLLKVAGISVLIGLIESCTARIRLIKIPQVLLGAFVLSVFALIIALFGRGRL